MITTYLRFPSQEVWEQAAAAVGVRVNNPTLIEEESIDPDTGDIIPAVYEDNWSWSYYTHEWGVDDVGVIYNDDGVYDQDTGEVITPPTPKDGWHVNYKSATLPSDLEAYVVSPTTPHRIFAGD
jgi:hypothetical protein